jgi:hypothetical protein
VSEILCFQVPPDHALESMEGWSRLDPQTFSAVRAHLVVIKRREAHPLTGPAISRVDVPAGSEYVIRRKEIEVTTQMAEVQQLVQRTVTTRINEEFVAKLSAEIGASGPLPTAKATTETQIKLLTELADAVQHSVAGKQSFQVQRTTEIERSLTVKTTADGTPVPTKHLYLYFGLWPWRWDFYLDRVELLRLRYQRRWLWPTVRETFAARTLTLRLPLFSLRFHEPQTEISVKDGDYTPDVADAEAIALAPLTNAMPALDFPLDTGLGDLARLAFPVTGAEREAAGRKTGGAVRGVKKAAAKRSGVGGGAHARKAAAKKAPTQTRSRKAQPRTVPVKPRPEAATPKRPPAGARKLSASTKRAAPVRSKKPGKSRRPTGGGRRSGPKGGR